MARNRTALSRELHEISSLTGVNWSVWLSRAEEWEILASYRVTATQGRRLLQYLRQPRLSAWLDGCFQQRGSRPRRLPDDLGLAETSLYVFPDEMTRGAIMVGCSRLSPIARRYWQTTVSGRVGQALLAAPAIQASPSSEIAIPYHLPEAMDRVLEACTRLAASSGGWLALRSGEFLEVKSQFNCRDFSPGTQISLEAHPVLAGYLQAPRVLQRRTGEAHWKKLAAFGVQPAASALLVMPLHIGKRAIGLVVLWARDDYTADELAGLEQMTERISSSVETSAVFADLVAHLHRMALLNDFVSTISTTQDVDQIASRMFALLSRAFNTDRINLVLLSADGNGAQQFLKKGNAMQMQLVPAGEISVSSTNDAERLFHPGQADAGRQYQPAYADSRSMMVVPLRYRHQLIGLLALESDKEAAFSVSDEHLLVVIASHLTGLIENSRLRLDAEQRANNLTLIHDVVEQVIGITDAWQVAQIAADLMARNFAYELVIVLLKEPGAGQALQVAGVGGSAASLVIQGLRRLDTGSDWGIANRVAATGENVLVSDLAADPDYRPIAHWDAGSEMCVSLRDAGTLYGVIEVRSQKKAAYAHTDLLVLESLAGILASVFSNVDHFQKLKTTVDELNRAREELQERIAAQKITESRLVQAAKLAAVGEMAAGVAHELNNPLTTVAGFTELVLQDMPSGNGSRSDLELVLKEAQRARAVVRRLLDFARQSDSVRIRSDINEVMDEVLTLVNHLLQTNGVELECKFTRGMPWVRIDRNQIKQVCLNLIHNALHAMPKGGRLCLQTASQKRDRRTWIVFSIRDNGIGIPPEQKERIFEPFFTTRSGTGGTGLGLSVSYGIVADHGGFIEVESQVDVGSVFTVWLPAEG